MDQGYHLFIVSFFLSVFFCNETNENKSNVSSSSLKLNFNDNDDDGDDHKKIAHSSKS